MRIDADNAAELLAGADAVLDGSDNFATRLAVADAALALRIPLVSAAVSQFEGQLGVYRGWEADKPCYRCFVGTDPDREGASCAEVGVLGAMAGVMGSLAALEVIRASCRSARTARGNCCWRTPCRCDSGRFRCPRTRSAAATNLGRRGRASSLRGPAISMLDIPIHRRG